VNSEPFQKIRNENMKIWGHIPYLPYFVARAEEIRDVSLISIVNEHYARTAVGKM